MTMIGARGVPLGKPHGARGSESSSVGRIGYSKNDFDHCDDLLLCNASDDLWLHRLFGLHRLRHSTNTIEYEPYIGTKLTLVLPYAYAVSCFGSIYTTMDAVSR